MGNGQSSSQRRPQSNPPRPNSAGVYNSNLQSQEPPPPVPHRPPTSYYAPVPPPEPYVYGPRLHSYYYNGPLYGQNPYGQAMYSAPAVTNYTPQRLAHLHPAVQQVVPEPQRTSTIKNDVNLKRATLRLEADPENPGYHLVAFSFDATVAGSVCVFFMTREGEDCSFKQLQPEKYTPIRVPFEQGLGQKFVQASGTGVKLSLFDEAELAREGKENEFPLVVRTETVPRDPPQDAPPRDGEPPGAKLPKWVQSQTTYAIVERKDDGQWGIKVLRQKIWVNGMRYELQDIYGIEQWSGGGADNGDTGKECVICMSEPRDTTVLPCRHMCMCRECAQVLRFQTNRCPICRCVVERLLEIKMAKENNDPDVAAQLSAAATVRGNGSGTTEQAAPSQESGSGSSSSSNSNSSGAVGEAREAGCCTTATGGLEGGKAGAGVGKQGVQGAEVDKVVPNLATSLEKISLFGPKTDNHPS